jgi:Fumarate reductase flavoprotein C-term
MGARPENASLNMEALLREESRSAHHREDFPEQSEERRTNILCARDHGGEMHLWTEPVAEVPADIPPRISTPTTTST